MHCADAALEPTCRVYNTIHRDRHGRYPACAEASPPYQQRQRDGPSTAEQHLNETLVQEYERALLVRAEALARLQARGRDIAPLPAPATG